MERLTKREEGTVIFNVENEKACKEIEEIANKLLEHYGKEQSLGLALRQLYLHKLADYEDLEFTPEELKTFIPMIK